MEINTNSALFHIKEAKKYLFNEVHTKAIENSIDRLEEAELWIKKHAENGFIEIIREDF